MPHASQFHLALLQTVIAEQPEWDGLVLTWVMMRFTGTVMRAVFSGDPGPEPGACGAGSSVCLSVTWRWGRCPMSDDPACPFGSLFPRFSVALPAEEQTSLVPAPQTSWE